MSIKLNTPDYPSLLNKIRKRPQMYHGGKERSTILLDTFICGIQYSEAFHEIELDNRMSGFDWKRFEGWVAEKYNPRRLTLRSFSLAEYLTKCESKGFDLWFEWYDEFSARRVTS